MPRKMCKLRLGKQDFAQPARTGGSQVMRILGDEAPLGCEHGHSPEPVGAEQGEDIDKHIGRNPRSCCIVAAEFAPQRGHSGAIAPGRGQAHHCAVAPAEVLVPEDNDMGDSGFLQGAGRADQTGYAVGGSCERDNGSVDRLAGDLRVLQVLAKNRELIAQVAAAQMSRLHSHVDEVAGVVAVP